jgi:esterase/lipase
MGRLLLTFLFALLTASHAHASFVYLPAKTPAAIVGVTLVVHGLNLKPSKMLALADALVAENQGVVLVSLAGHGKDEKEFGKVTRERWLSDVVEGYQEAVVKAKAKGVPVHFLGFSLGGLLGVDLLASGKVQFTKMVLLAPALRVHARSRLIRLARILGRSFVIPSRSPEDYRAHSGTTVAAYEALFESIDALPDSSFESVNVPTRVFVDPDDELVSADKIKELMKKQNLTNWQFNSVDANKSQTSPKYHHLIIDSKSLGEAEWQKLISAIRSFLAT